MRHWFLSDLRVYVCTNRPLAYINILHPWVPPDTPPLGRPICLPENSFPSCIHSTNAPPGPEQAQRSGPRWIILTVVRLWSIPPHLARKLRCLNIPPLRTTTTAGFIRSWPLIQNVAYVRLTRRCFGNPILKTEYGYAVSQYDGRVYAIQRT